MCGVKVWNPSGMGFTLSAIRITSIIGKSQLTILTRTKAVRVMSLQ
jgi:hypothetical protein